MNIIDQYFKSFKEVTPQVISSWFDISSYYHETKNNKKENIIITKTSSNRIRMCLQNSDKVLQVIKQGQMHKNSYESLIHYWQKYKFFSLPQDKLAKAVFRTAEGFRNGCDKYEELATSLAYIIQDGKGTQEDKENFLKYINLFYIFYQYYQMYVIMGKIR